MLQVRKYVILSIALVLWNMAGVLTAAERLSDEELATRYGGCYTHYECEDGQDCPSATGCVDSLDLCCRGCETRAGKRCSDPWTNSTSPGQTCNDSINTCPGGCLTKGYCNWGECVKGDMNGSEYPDCNENSYQKCIVTDAD